MKKILRIFLVLFIIGGIVIGSIFFYKKIWKKDDGKPTQVVKKLDNIKGFDYNLYDNSTKLYKDLYYELKEVLETEPIDYEKYAEIVSEMFVADFYSLNTRITNKDVGGLDFIYSKIRDNFKLKATDTLYKYVESNVYGDRKQVLPEVEAFKNVTVKKETYNYITSEDAAIAVSISDPDSYTVKLEWSYRDGLNYQSSATIKLVHEDRVLSIVSVE